MAYVKSINPNTIDSHQTSPSYVITFIPQDNRDRYRYSNSKKYKESQNLPKEDEKFNYDFYSNRMPIVVENDATSVAISHSKSSPNPSLSITLMAGDVNYATAVGAGDYVTVNMIDSEQLSRDIAQRARDLKPINEYTDGFKGLFKVQTVRRKLQTDPMSGSKVYYFEVTAFGFTEYNNSIYYNPVLTDFDKDGKFFLNNFSNYLQSLIGQKGTNNVQNLIQILVSALIGTGDIQSPDTKQEISPNRIYKIPKNVGLLLGTPKAKKIIDISKFYYGIWNASTTNATNPAAGFNSVFTKTKGNIHQTNNPIQGTRVLAAEYWNCVKVWSILQSYSNDLINEMYTAYRTAPDGKVYPSLVVRQKPFTSSMFSINTLTTRFLDLPRWKINPDLVYNLDIGKDEASRINFVQVFTRSIAPGANNNLGAQTALGNYVPVYEDIAYHGLKPYVATTNFDWPDNEGKPEGKAVLWSRLVADWVIGGHNRESGTMQTVGIVDPICVGDNLEFDGIVYHIEAISHQMSIQGDRKSFRTNLTLSNGVDKNSTPNSLIYPESSFTKTTERREDDFNREKILPGLSDSQDISARVKGEDIKKPKKDSPSMPNQKAKTYEK